MEQCKTCNNLYREWFDKEHWLDPDKWMVLLKTHYKKYIDGEKFEKSFHKISQKQAFLICGTIISDSSIYCMYKNPDDNCPEYEVFTGEPPSHLFRD